MKGRRFFRRRKKTPMAKPGAPSRADVERYRQNYIVEMDGIALYRAMADAEADEQRAAIFEKLAQNEERHAQRWARLIQSGGGAGAPARLDGAPLRHRPGGADHQQPGGARRSRLHAPARSGGSAGRGAR